MARIELPYVQRFKDRHGRMRHYFRKPGCKRMVLPGPAGSDAFMAAYAEALGTVREIGATKYASGTIGALIAAYYGSGTWAELQPQTQRQYRGVLDAFRDTYGSGRVKMFTAEFLVRILDKMADRPDAAARLLKLLRGLYKFGKARKLVTFDPTADVKLKRRKTSGFRAWTDDDIERFEAHWPPGSRARLALYLLLYTGQRRSDVVTMGRQHVREGYLSVTQAKTGAQLQIPLHPALRAEIGRLPKTQLTFIMTEAGKPMSPFGFSNWFAECAQKAGLPERSSPHGLRKACARWLAEAGRSSLEIAAITGHASLKEVERYTKSASQKRLAASAIAALPNRRRTGKVKPHSQTSAK